MLDWLTGKGDPDFWKKYSETFDKTDANAPIRYVVFDCEKTGQDWKEDQITSIGCIGVVSDSIQVGDFYEVFIQNQTEENHQNEAVEKLFKVNVDTIIESEALPKFLDYIKNATLVGHSTNLDIEMLNQALKKMNLGKLKNEVIDINVMHQRFKNLSEDQHHTLDQLCDIYKVKKNSRSTASGNAYSSALVFLKLRRKLKMK
ncbi:exonuclease domain-containing protein [Flavobacterium sp.]|uniref:exonuclease domain-containing protein n=1 Tax=Flavobacterium sp. TaxID=239 RepID=UPI0028BDA373|nr:exonuclease domain-containing protein [Flavobacterium sp.]